MNVADDLDSARDAFNAYASERALPAAHVRKDEANRLSFAHVASRIEDTSVRTRYIELAVALLEANIQAHKPDAARIEAPSSSPAPVVAALLGAAVAYWWQGPVAALAAAALLYWSFHRQAVVVLRDRRRAAEEHNAFVDSWQRTVDGWREDIRELKEVERRMRPE